MRTSQCGTINLRERCLMCTSHADWKLDWGNAYPVGKTVFTVIRTSQCTYILSYTRIYIYAGRSKLTWLLSSINYYVYHIIHIHYRSIVNAVKQRERRKKVNVIYICITTPNLTTRCGVICPESENYKADTQTHIRTQMKFSYSTVNQPSSAME